MSDIVLSVHQVGKKYYIGSMQEKYKTLRDTLSDVFLAPFRKAAGLLRGHATAAANLHEILWALKDISFEVKEGEVVGIIGRNGAGKSTLLKVLSRITEPSEGYIDVFGRVGSLLEVGTGFHPELTGRENVFLNGAILGMKRVEIEQKFDEIVAFAEIEKFIDTPVKHYSSGMYVRLAFAVAAHLEPEILVVDEVLAVGDVAFQKKCLGKMQNVSREGRTVLFVSHNMAAVRDLCQRGIWLENGQIFKSGTIMEVTTQYLESMFDSTMSACDVRHHQRISGYGKHVRINSVALNGGTPVFHGRSLTIEFEFDIFRETDHVAIGIGFNSLDGVRILSFDSDLIEEGRHFFAGTEGRLAMRVDEFYLQPGIYSVDVGIRSGSKASQDYLPACFQVEVLPSEKTPPMIVRPDGGVRLPAMWDWRV